MVYLTLNISEVLFIVSKRIELTVPPLLASEMKILGVFKNEKLNLQTNLTARFARKPVDVSISFVT